MERALPIYELVIDAETDGTSFVSLVNHPAIDRPFHAFASQRQRFTETEKRVLSGPLLIPDQLIYRNLKKYGECYVTMTRETIYQTAQKFLRLGFQNNVNKEHAKKVDGVFMFESFIVDRERGIMPPKVDEDLPDGTWYGSFKVDNDEVWNQYIKTGRFTGFSIEGDYGMEAVDPQASEEELAEFIVEMAKIFAHKINTKHLQSV